MINPIIIARAQGKSYNTIIREQHVTNREIAQVSTGNGILQEYQKLAEQHASLVRSYEKALWVSALSGVVILGGALFLLSII